MSIMHTVYMPVGFDHEVWRDKPSHWEAELRDAKRIARGTAEFLVADILGSKTVQLQRRGRIPRAPDGTNFVVATLDCEPCDQGDTVGDVVERIRDDLKDWDWPMSVTFYFWRHRQKAERLKVTSPCSCPECGRT
jgi:hypothetical protein